MQYWPLFQLSDDAHVGGTGLRPYENDVRLSRPRRACALAGHHPENAASRKLLQKLGFEFTGEQLYAPTGLMHPSYRLEA